MASLLEAAGWKDQILGFFFDRDIFSQTNFALASHIQTIPVQEVSFYTIDVTNPTSFIWEKAFTPSSGYDISVAAHFSIRGFAVKYPATGTQTTSTPDYYEIYSLFDGVPSVKIE